MSKNRKFSGLNLQFIFYFLLFSYIPLVTFSILGYYVNKNLLYQENEAELLELTTITAANLERSIETIEHLALPKSQTQKQLYKSFDTILQNIPEKIRLSVYNDRELIYTKNKKIITGQQKTPEDDFWSFLFGGETLLSKASLMNGWQLIYEVSVSDIYGRLKTFLHKIIVANIIIGILMFAIALFLSRKITWPILSLVDAVKDIGSGNLSQPIVIKGKDEIRTLAVEFEKMRQKLQESYFNLEAKIEERTEALRDAQFQISHQEKMASLGLLSAGVAHEIGNPLTSISSMAQILKRKTEQPRSLEYLDTILENINRISRIVVELKEFARPTNYETTYVNINELVRDAVNIVKYDQRAKSVKIHMEMDRNLPELYLVADQLHQVFLNILINAFDALQNEKDQIFINTCWNNEHVLIKFKDSGVGIEEEHQKKIFEPFFTTKKVGKGTGLGLSVSYGIIKNFNGSIEVESTPGKGSLFTVKLPVNKRSTEDES